MVNFYVNGHKISEGETDANFKNWLTNKQPEPEPMDDLKRQALSIYLSKSQPVTSADSGGCACMGKAKPEDPFCRCLMHHTVELNGQVYLIARKLDKKRYWYSVTTPEELFSPENIS